MNYLSAEQITAIHDRMISRVRGAVGVREPELLKSIANKPQIEFDGHELYPEVFSKAAALYEALCNYHVFTDGNKRTALLAMYRFLTVNGYDLDISNQEAESYTVRIVKDHLAIVDVAQWVQPHSRAI